MSAVHREVGEQGELVETGRASVAYGLQGLRARFSGGIPACHTSTEAGISTRVVVGRSARRRRGRLDRIPVAPWSLRPLQRTRPTNRGVVIMPAFGDKLGDW